MLRQPGIFRTSGLRIELSQEGHHLCCVLGYIESDHLFVEGFGLSSWDADRMKAVGKQNPIHHQACRAPIPIEKELLQSSKKKAAQGPFKRVGNLLKGDNALIEHSIEFRRAPHCGERMIAFVFAQGYRGRITVDFPLAALPNLIKVRRNLTLLRIG
ncbi:MAG: hypothetical protein ACOYKZ_05570, partial [Chlamydiia bacterium]